MKQFKKAWKLSHDLLVKRHGRFMYVTTLESHKDGYPHLYALLLLGGLLLIKMS